MIPLMKSLDGMFPYPTPKIARIKDSKLGLLRYALMFLIIIYVVGYQIMWRGNHLETQELSGVYQLQLDAPTRNNCDPMNVECMQNFTSMSGLPYCSQSPSAGPIKLPCEYWDANQLRQITDQGLMIPTHSTTYFQTAGCKPSVMNNWTCVGWLYDFLDKKGERQEKRGQATPIDDIFIADIERYTLMIDHSARSTLGSRTYAADMVGYWLDCNTENQSDARCVPRPITCGHKRCMDKEHTLAQTRTLEHAPKFRGDRRSLSLAHVKTEIASHRRKKAKSFQKIGPDANVNENLLSEEPAENKEVLSQAAVSLSGPNGKDNLPSRVEHLESLGVVSLSQGDIFTIGTLLRAANVSLDKRRHDVPSWIGGSYRSSGFVLVIRIHYSNIESWLGMKVLPWNVQGPTLHYTYRITKHASHDDYMLREVKKGGPRNDSRVVKEYHGIRVLVEQSGSVAVWDNIQLLLILTTTLALMAVSNCITDTVALYALPSSDAYWSVKYERPRAKKEATARGEQEESEEPLGRRDSIGSITM